MITGGTITHRADLLDGTNVITMTAMSGSGPNLDTLEVFPNQHSNIGTWRGNFDNSGSLFIVSSQAILESIKRRNVVDQSSTGKSF